MKHVIAAVTTILALAAMFKMYQSDKEVHKLEEIRNIIAKTKMEVKLERTVQSIEKKNETKSDDMEMEKEREKKRKEVEAKLQALKNKAGNLAAFDVSPLYKQKCASCHGVNGEGIIGPKLIGKSAKEVYSALSEFKSGTRKNYVMYGLLSKMNDEQIKALSEEIGRFSEKLERK